MAMMTSEEYMGHCLELAEGGYGQVNPNPMVGCVIERNGRIVGEGYHRRFGGDHAEIMALKRAGRSARGATLYVNLEPCSHHGKTPPCVDAIIRSGIKKIIASSRDPNPLVAGKGFRKLRQAGIRVMIGTLRSEARLLNEKFFGFMETGLPFVGIKLAQTIDGKIADSFGKSKWITSELARAYGHFLRSGYDAVLVGAGTIRQDDPLLTVRAARGRSPRRIVLDGSFSLSPKSRIVRNRSAETIVLTSHAMFRSKKAKVLMLERKGVQVLGVDSSPRMKPAHVLKVLAGLGITSVLIEGGATAIEPFLQENLVKKVHCFIAPKLLGSGLAGIRLKNLPLSRAKILDDMTVSILGDDILLEGMLR